MAFADIRNEIPRTFFHILGGLFLAWIGYSFASPLNRVLLGGIFAGAVAVETVRLLVPRANELAKSIIGPFMRPHEDKNLTGAPAFTGGVFLAFVLFRQDVALAAMVPLVFGDRAALIVGKGMGKLSFKGKTLEGSLACLATSFLVYALGARSWPEILGWGWAVLFGASLAGTLAEALPRPFDDNLTIPIAVGLFLTIVS